MTTREEVESFAQALDDALWSKAAALLRSLLAERDEAIRHAGNMAARGANTKKRDINSWLALQSAIDAFRAWRDGK